VASDATAMFWGDASGVKKFAHWDQPSTIPLLEEIDEQPTSAAHYIAVPMVHE
jgi:hypothetical protein